jgi:hypothetical protein
VTISGPLRYACGHDLEGRWRPGVSTVAERCPECRRLPPTLSDEQLELEQKNRRRKPRPWLR